MDVVGYVNNVIYFRWCELVRIIYFEKIDIDFSFRDGVGFILGW